MSKELHREKCQGKYIEASVTIQESEITGFNKVNITNSSYRVYKDDKAGIYYFQGNISDEEGYEKAEKNLELNRPYPFELETGVRHRSLEKYVPADDELMSLSKRCLSYLKKNYPDYIFNGSISCKTKTESRSNDLGMDYSTSDGHAGVSIEFKHKDSKDIIDGSFGFSERKFTVNKFKKYADYWLANFTKTVEMPEECIIMDQYYGYTGFLKNCLDVEQLKLKTSLLTGKIGQKIFADNFTIYHDVSDKNSWMNNFWDGDGTVPKGDRVYFIRNGKVLRGYADKKTAKKYHVKPVAGSANNDFADIPGNGGAGMTIKTERKSPKDMLNGKLAIIPLIASGGGFKEKGEYTMPVQTGLLTDGEKILGRVPPFTMTTNMFDMFGKDFIGVSKHSDIFNDKVILFRADIGKL